MARCQYLQYESRGVLFSQGDYYCDICKKYLSESEVNNKCNTSYSEDYKQCVVYKKHMKY